MKTTRVYVTMMVEFDYDGSLMTEDEAQEKVMQELGYEFSLPKESGLVIEDYDICGINN